MDAYTFRAPWSKLLIILSVIFTFILLGAFSVGKFAHTPPQLVLIYPPLLLLLDGLLFTIRGYRLTSNYLYVKRLVWETYLDLKTLESTEINPDATKGSIRLFSNGGLCSINGLFSNNTLGNYRAFITDPKNAVILRLARRAIVISPEEPCQFCRQVE